MDKDELATYAWEHDFEKKWRIAHGMDKAPPEEIAYRAVMKRLDKQLQIKSSRSSTGRNFCLLRHIFVILDASANMLDEIDYLPNRLSCAAEALQDFVGIVLSRNPLAQIGIITTRFADCQILCDLTSNVQTLRDSLSKFTRTDSIMGEKRIRREIPFLQRTGAFDLSMKPAKPVDPNDTITLDRSLALALSYLKQSPSHSSREIVVILGSLNTIDDDDIVESTIPALVEAHVRCHTLSLSAETQIMNEISKSTNPEDSEVPPNHVILDRAHLEKVLTYIANNPIANKALPGTHICLAYPSLIKTKPTSCQLHFIKEELSDKDRMSCRILKTSHGFQCPQCGAIYCTIPVECNICALTLVSGEHVARSIQQTKPAVKLMELKMPMEGISCTGCDDVITSEHYKTNQSSRSRNSYFVFKCLKCKSTYCPECESMIRNVINFCPYCLAEGQ